MKHRDALHGDAFQDDALHGDALQDDALVFRLGSASDGRSAERRRS
ncbi:hypothetical protein J5Y04_07525 [Kitasatospora sp. RG8]|nr:hypothetical protein [Kitasatospora sp. RG8]MBP0449402.1 hypothetical protein [Kitasatospora sp. RG8]